MQALLEDVENLTAEKVAEACAGKEVQQLHANAKDLRLAAARMWQFHDYGNGEALALAAEYLAPDVESVSALKPNPSDIYMYICIHKPKQPPAK